MQVQLRQLEGSWDLGYALHKHTLSSVYVGDDEYGHPRFETTRSEPGEALYQLKYQADQDQVKPLAAQVKTSLLPLFGKIGLIIPMPASKTRALQPVDEIATELGRLIDTPVFNNIVIARTSQGSLQLKNLHDREEKEAALQRRFSINPAITNDGCWNALLLDDLFDTGTTMDAVCRTAADVQEDQPGLCRLSNVETSHDDCLHRRIDFHQPPAREGAGADQQDRVF